MIAMLCITACAPMSSALTIPRLEQEYAKWGGERVMVRGWSTGCDENWNVCGLAASPDLLPGKGYVQFKATPRLRRQLGGMRGRLVAVSGVYRAGCTGQREDAALTCFTGDAFADLEGVTVVSISKAP